MDDELATFTYIYARQCWIVSREFMNVQFVSSGEIPLAVGFITMLKHVVDPFFCIVCVSILWVRPSETRHERKHHKIHTCCVARGSRRLCYVQQFLDARDFIVLIIKNRVVVGIDCSVIHACDVHRKRCVLIVFFRFYFLHPLDLVLEYYREYPCVGLFYF